VIKDNLTTTALVKSIKALLKAQNISQAELARRSRLPPTNINRLLNSEDTDFSPQLDTVVAIAYGFGISISEILNGVESKNAKIVETPKTISKQVSRLIEDFLLSSEEGRIELLRTAEHTAALNESV
jgi:transcriptional regulator with XRE-family HTH domain